MCSVVTYAVWLMAFQVHLLDWTPVLCLILPLPVIQCVSDKEGYKNVGTKTCI